MILTQYSVKFRVAVFTLVAALLIVGPYLYLTLPREGAPDVTIPYVFVTAPYAGVAPAEIENLVTIPLERRINDLENVKELNSTSAEGLSFVAVEFTPEQDIDFAVQKVKEKIDLAKPDLPGDLEQPVVQGMNFSTDIPVLTFTISGDRDLERLRRIGEDLQDEIERVPGVLQVRLFGTREREIRVDVDLSRLTAYGLTFGEVAAALRRENATTSAGNLEITGDKIQVRVPGEFTDVRELQSIVVRTDGDRPIYLGDVATVTDSYKDVTTVSRIGGEPCVSLALHKRAGENADRLIRQVKKLLTAQALPPGIGVTLIDDQSEWIRMMIEDLENNIASGFLLVVVVLLLFMGFRNSVLVALAIPLSIMLGFVVLAMCGMTLNMMVLFSLVLTVGMLVDNAIVIVENIYRHHTEGESRLSASLQGAAEVAWPVTTSTLTTLVAFLPMMFWPGIMGQFMGFLPKTVIIMLSASLFVALVINPSLCTVLIRRPRDHAGGRAHARWERFVNLYERVLRGALAHRFLTTLIGVAFLFLSVVVFGRYNNGVELFPESDPRRCVIQVRYAEGTPIGVTDATLRAIEKQVAAYGDVKFFLSNVGSGGEQSLSGSSGPHLGSMIVEFVPYSQRQGSTRDLVARIRTELGTFPGAQVKVEQEKEGPPTGAPVSIELAGPDFEVLAALADDVKRRVADVPGLVDVQDNLEDARPELRFRVDRERAAVLGYDAASIGYTLRTAVNGEAASKFRAGEEEYDITVRLREDQRRSADLLKQMTLSTPDGRQVPLAALGTFSYAGGRGQIMRKDQRRVISVTGNNQGRGVDKILADVQKRLADLPLPRGYSVGYAGDTEEMNEASAFLSKAFLVALALIAIILIMQFNSVLLPFNILFSVILSMIGVMWGLLAWQLRFGVIMTGIGVITLAGVVVNNGIVLLDCALQAQREGLSATEAIVRAGRLRLRPVLLTAITTVIGLFPMAVGWGLDVHAWPWRISRGAEMSQWWAPMAVAVMFGLGVATVLTLVQAPVMYSLADSLTRFLSRRFGTGEEPAESPAAK